jgi:hypothetical protein
VVVVPGAASRFKESATGGYTPWTAEPPIFLVAAAGGGARGAGGGRALSAGCGCAPFWYSVIYALKPVCSNYT